VFTLVCPFESHRVQARINEILSRTQESEWELSVNTSVDEMVQLTHPIKGKVPRLRRIQTVETDKL